MNKENLLTALKKFNEEISPEDLFPAYSLEAQTLVTNDPFAFLVALCLDRGTKAEIIWSIPLALQKKMGRLIPDDFYNLSEEEIGKLINGLPYKPRYLHDVPRTLIELARIVVEDYGGRTELIWEGKKAQEVNKKLLEIHGVGPGIANMGLLLIEKAFGPQFSKEEHKLMDVKPDVHTKRVLYRLGLANQIDVTEAIIATRILNPEYPGELDGPLWIIGKRWCYAANPDCESCYVNLYCPKRIE